MPIGRANPSGLVTHFSERGSEGLIFGTLTQAINAGLKLYSMYMVLYVIHDFRLRLQETKHMQDVACRSYVG